MLKRILSIAAVAAFATVFASACAPTSTQANDRYDVVSNYMSDNQIAAAVSAADAYAGVHITENAEVANIKRYITESTTPGFLGYVTLFTLGRPIAYYAVHGPVTGCARELTPNQHVTDGKGWYTGSGNSTVDSPNDEGTYGEGPHCIFFYTEDGVMIRWSGEYLYSDKPIRLSEKPLVLSIKDSK